MKTIWSRLACWWRGEHWYVSTSCQHGIHTYCQAHDGMSGTKKPSQCKFCAAPCRCTAKGCHDGQG